MSSHQDELQIPGDMAQHSDLPGLSSQDQAYNNLEASSPLKLGLMGEDSVLDGALDGLKNSDDLGSGLMKELHDLELGPLDKVHQPEDPNITSKTVSRSQSPHVPNPVTQVKNISQKDIRRNSNLVSITSESPLGSGIKKSNPASSPGAEDETSKISAYARLDFENFTFFVQTLQVVLGRKSNDELLQSSHHAVDVHLSSKKAISRRHAKIFYNFGTQRFEISILGRNGAFVDDTFVEKGITVPLADGTKIQIGDLPFQFVLPSIEPSEEDSSSIPSKQFNPSDAINLRSNLYNTNPQKKVIKAPKKEPLKRKDSISESKEPTTEQAKDATSRRDSILKIRRLSNARRKSLASAANDEINDILKELGVSSIDAIDEEDSELLDSQIQAMLSDHNEERPQVEESLLKLSQFNESAIEEEEDEIDKLVKQHNLEQGVTLEDDDDNTHDLDMDLSLLDQEIASLGPLIDAHNQDLMKEKEERRRKLELERDRKRKQQLQKKLKAAVKDEHELLIPDNSSPPHTSSTSPRAAPLMGKPATPRMGKAASIQPPANRLYNRPPIIDSRYTLPGGIPTNTPGLPLKLPQGMIYNGLQKPIVPPRPPPPKLEVSVLPVTSEPSAVRPRPPLRAITVSGRATLSTFGVPKTVEEPSKFPKVPKRRTQSNKKLPKKIYTLDEIPEEFRSKPSISLPVLITNSLKANRENGLTLNELYEYIKEAYPYYKYCPEGWQFTVSHNVKLNKIFKRKMKRDSEWVFVIDELFLIEREKVRKKQSELIAARAKAADLKAEELKQRQRLEAQQAISNNIVGRGFASPYGLPNPSHLPYNSQIQYRNPVVPGPIVNGQKPKTIAELASEIRRDGVITSKAPMYFKPQSSMDVKPVPNPTQTNTIKAQLAANRSQPSSQSPPPTNSPSPVSSGMNQDTKKSLAYLQKELFTLYKVRKLSYNTATTTEIITKALATTIAQVNVIGAKAGCGDNALSFLVERAPQQVSKILDIALTKSIKEKQGNLSVPSSRAGTPGPSSQNTSPQKTPQITPPISLTPQPTMSQPIATPTPVHVKPAVGTSNPSPEPIQQMIKEEPLQPTINATTQAPTEVSVSPSAPKPNPTNSPKASNSLVKPPSFGGGLSRPPSYKSNTTLSKPQGFSKPGGLSRPPSFLSNKPSQRPETNNNTGAVTPQKRELDENDTESPRKIVKSD